MKVVRKNQSQKHKNSDSCIAIEYPLGDKDINGAVVTIKGRYPEKGRVVNEKCKELCYILEGGGKIVIEGEEIELNKEDMILIEAGEKIYWDGDMKMYVSCNPAWHHEQHKEIEQ